MGKSTKNSATKVDTAAALAPTKTLKKGKREAEQIIEKTKSARKQKKDDHMEVIAKKKAEVKTVKKKVDSSSSEDSSSDSEPEQKVKVPAKKVVAPSKVPPKVESSSDDSSSDDEPAVKKVLVAAAKNGAVKKGKSSSSESDSSDESDSDEDTTAKMKPVSTIKNGPVAAANESDSEDSSSDDDVPAAKKNSVAAVKNATVPAAKKGDSSDESDSEDSSEEEVSTFKVENDDVEAKVAVVAPKGTNVVFNKNQTSSESESDEDTDSSDEDVPAPAINKVTSAVAKKEKESSDDSEDESSEESSDEEEPKQKKMKVQQMDAEMVDSEQTPRKEPTTPVTPIAQTSEGSKTVFVGNLPYKVEKADMENFFKEVGEVVDVRFAMRPDGFMKGFGHVEFASADAAKKAVEEMNGKELMGRGLRLDLAAERGEYTPQSGVERNSFQKSEGGQGLSIFIRGLDSNEDLFKIKDGLKEHFGSCGEITRLYVPTDPEGYVKGTAYMDFVDNDAFNKALELDQSEFGQSVLSVVEAKPKVDNNAGGGRGGRSGGRFGSGGRDSGGRFGSRGRGDRGGRGRFGGGGRGGRGTPGRPTMATTTTGTGKKTTFDN